MLLDQKVSVGKFFVLEKNYVLFRNYLINAKAAIMRLTLPKLGRTSCLVSILPELGDTSLVQANLGDFLERARNPRADSMMERIVRSGLIEASAFPTAAPCLELVITCMNRYDVESRSIRTSSGELLVEIN